ncbi:hypothetical protein AAKU67_000085 [Oxalobacteraceae bacterium GrIS 2.11]
METLALNQSRFQSKVLFCALIVAIAAMALVFQHHVLKGRKTIAASHPVTKVQAAGNATQRIVISGKRMTMEEKLAYDAAAVNLTRIDRYQRANQ